MSFDELQSRVSVERTAGGERQHSRDGDVTWNDRNGRKAAAGSAIL